MLSIIINHYRTPELLKLCIQSIEKNLSAIEHEIIVRDGEAMEETGEMMREAFPQVTYLPENYNVGFAKLVNEGIRVSKGELLLIINADIIIANAESVQKLIDYLSRSETCGVVGPKLLNMNGSLQQSCFRFYKPFTLLFRRTFLGKTPWGERDIARFTYDDLFGKSPETAASGQKSAVPVDWLMGSALLAKRKAVETVGSFDENFFMYFEDVDWCRRFWEKGWKVMYFPEAVFYHYHMQASRGKKGLFEILANKYTRIHVFSAFKYFRKYGVSVPRYGI